MDVDSRLPSLLKKANIARISGNSLLVGDRRRYPWEHTFVSCASVDDIARAIRDMVTQGGGPLQVAMTTMRFLARQIHDGTVSASMNTFLDAARLLSAARSTNTTMHRTLDSIVVDIASWYQCGDMKQAYGDDFVAFVDTVVDTYEQRFDADYDTMSDIGSTTIADGEGILTTCFAEHSFILSLVKAREQGKRITIYVPETRPYLQGARLTAPALAELGIQAYLITDGMGVHMMAQGVVSHYMTAADLVAMDGTVVNKVGTLANAVGADYYHIPYHVFAMSPDITKAGLSDIVMEERDGAEILRFNGVPTTLETMVGRYPAFDCIPASLVDAIITPRGLTTPAGIGALYGVATAAGQGDIP